MKNYYPKLVGQVMHFCQKTRLAQLLFICVFLFVSGTSYSQVTIAFNLTADAGNQGLNGNIRICNNSGGTLPDGYSIRFRWPSLVGFDNGPTATRNGPGACDTWTLSFASWQLPLNGQCKDVSTGRSIGAYTAPLAYPAYGIDQFGNTVQVVNGGNQYIPKSYNQTKWQYNFDPSYFIPTQSPMCLGQAQIREWNALWDVRVPQNRKHWALVSAHVSTLFNNMAGANVTSMNYVFAQSMIEGKMGCDNGMVPRPGDDNPLVYDASSVSNGCFQIKPEGWAQIQQYYPSLTGSLTYNNIIVGGNFVTSALSKVLYDMSTFAKYEKINCANPIGFFLNSADPYVAEEILAYSYHEGPMGSVPALTNIMVTNRATLLTNNNIAKYLQQNFANGSTQYSERMRNNLIQFENNFGVPGGNSALSTQAQTNWVGGSPPTGYQWHGCYDEAFTWAEISAYIDEVARLFWTANVPTIKTQVQTVFNSINGGGPVNYSQLARVIDEIVLRFPAYSPDEGIGEYFFASACGSASASMSTCDKICPGQNGELWIHLMGTPPFAYTVQGPGGVTYNRSGINVATDVLIVNQPGTYRITSLQDANGTVFINNHHANGVVQQPSGCALPVDFLHVNAYSYGANSIKLDWATISEINNHHFVVEKSSNGYDFFPIHQQTGAGTTTEIQQYSYIDHNPLQGENFYRVRQVDENGVHGFSKITTCSFGALSEVQIIPNPNKGSFVINTGDDASLSYEVVIYNILGKECYKYSGNKTEIKIEDNILNPGVYVVSVRTDTRHTTQRMIVE